MNKQVKSRKVNRFYESEKAFVSDINRMYKSGITYIEALHNVKDHCNIMVDNRVYTFSIYDTIKDVKNEIAMNLNISTKNIDVYNLFDNKDTAPLHSVGDAIIKVNLGYKTFKENINFDFKDSEDTIITKTFEKNVNFN
jgi:hypothetical protein